MRPLKITIQGNYYDCQIYRGRLYLWTFDGLLIVVDWDDLIRSAIISDHNWLPVSLGFLDGNYLYKSGANRIFNDPEFKALLLKRYNQVAETQFTITENNIQNSLIGVQSVPSNLLSTDTEIFGNNLYYINEKGLFRTATHRAKSEKYPLSTRPSQLWDCNLLSIKANKYPQIALSAGGEGLFELNLISSILPTKLSRVETTSPIFKISNKHSSFANYSFLSIYNTSLIKDSYLALFNWHFQNQEEKEGAYRDYDNLVSDKELFGNNMNEHSVSWGIDDKLYRASQGGFEIIKFDNNAKEGKFIKLKRVNFHDWKGKAVSGGSSYFGNIIECENALVVVQSDGEILTIPEEVTRWRVYPRSLNYENHLHVVLNDRIEIYSFNHDYFVNQKEKGVGIEYKPEIISYRRKRNNNTFDDLIPDFGPANEGGDNFDLPF